MKNVVWNLRKELQYYKGIRMMADTGLHEQLAAVIQEVLPKGSRILDYGTGEGALSQRLHDLGYQVYSVDIEPEKFKAETCFERLDFNSAADIAAFRAEHAEEFDMVLGIEVIEHVENPWQYIRDLMALVKPGGHILVSTPNVTSWYSRTEFFFTGRLHQFADNDRHYGHINPVAEDELRYISQQLGLTVEIIRPAGWLPRLWLERSPSQLLRNIFGFLGSFRMKGTWRGWCLMALLKKPEGGNS